MANTNIVKPESFTGISFLLLMFHFSYSGTRMKLELTFPSSKKEIAEALALAFEGSINPSNESVRVCLTSRNSFKLAINALKKLRGRTTIPQLDVYIKTIEQHLAVSVTTQRAHRAAMRKNSSVVTLNKLLPDSGECSPLTMLMAVT